MCDTLCALGRERTLFAKNSDRPRREAQLFEAHPRRPAGGRLRTQYLELDDRGAFAVLGSRPEWLWGFEHGLNEHKVAIGNERVFTRDDPHAEPPALIGMDLVRLGLEQAATAEAAVDVITGLIERHGQGGSCDREQDDPYFSSFLVADPTQAWILETSARTWAARPVDDSAAISNRLILGADWARASTDVSPGADFDQWRDPASPTGHADRRLAASRRCLAAGGDGVTPAALAGHLRDHGDASWGRPGERGAVVPPPPGFEPDGTGVTVCMHLRGLLATAAGMVAELPRDPDEPARVWVAPGNPCVSVFVPVRPGAVPGVLTDPAVWKQLARLREAVEADPPPVTLAEVRAELDPLEVELWAGAADLVTPTQWVSFASSASSRFRAAIAALAARTDRSTPTQSTPMQSTPMQPTRSQP